MNLGNISYKIYLAHYTCQLLILIDLVVDILVLIVVCKIKKDDNLTLFEYLFENSYIAFGGLLIYIILSLYYKLKVFIMLSVFKSKISRESRKGLEKIEKSLNNDKLSNMIVLFSHVLSLCTQSQTNK
jgi:hypothetical protein